MWFNDRTILQKGTVLHVRELVERADREVEHLIARFHPILWPYATACCLARRRSRRLKLADPALHARPDRGEAVVPDGVDRPDYFLQASPASKSSDHVCRGVGQAPRQGLEPAQLIQILLQLVSECRQWIAIHSSCRR